MAVSIVAQNARRIMAERGLKHGAIAKRAGYNENQFSAIMNGRRTIRDTDVSAIANALEVTPNELFEAYPSATA